jgi:hypothetical protein
MVVTKSFRMNTPLRKILNSQDLSRCYSNFKEQKLAHFMVSSLGAEVKGFVPRVSGESVLWGTKGISWLTADQWAPFDFAQGRLFRKPRRCGSLSCVGPAEKIKGRPSRQRDPTNHRKEKEGRA